MLLFTRIVVRIVTQYYDSSFICILDKQFCISYRRYIPTYHIDQLITILFHVVAQYYDSGFIC